MFNFPITTYIPNLNLFITRKLENENIRLDERSKVAR